jgi:PAS domain S-box-containing protein
MMKILYVEDNPSDADLTRRWLRRLAPHMTLETVATQSDAIARITKQESPHYDLILTDLRLPDGDGLSLLTYIQERGLPFAVVVITGTGDEKTAITALKAGADDYVSKRDDYLERLPITLENALRYHRAQAARQSRPLKALYAERHDTDIDLTLRHLRRYAPHIQLDVARTGAEVLQRFPQAGEASRYDVILLDYSLPGLNALEVLKELRRDRAMGIPVVLVTGQGDEEVALQALKLGAAGYLVKNPGYLHQLPGELENAFYRAEIIREQAALKQSEERLRQAQRAARVGTWDWNLVTGESNWSEGIYELLGLEQGDGRASVEDFVGFLHPEDREPAMDKAQSVIRNGEEYYDEFRVIRPDGSVAWLASKGRVIRDESGSAERMIGVNIDITERKRGEEALRESEARFRNMADNSPVMVWMADADGAGTYVSQSWYEFTGQAPGTALGSGWVAALYPDDRERSEKTFLAANEKREAFRLEYRLRRNDGEYRWVIDSARPRFGSQGEFLGYIGSVVDVTETKRAELNTQFINQLDFELSQITDADEIIRLATGRLGEYLGVASCYVIEVNPAAGLAFVRESWEGWRNAGPSIVGEYRISDFVTPECLDEFEVGRATVVKDVMNDPRIRDFASKYKSIGVGAFISIPALNDRQWEANLTVDHPQARDWRPDETQLMRDITARLWSAYKRARAVEALRDSEERLRHALEAGRMGVWERDTRIDAVKWSKESYTILGLSPFSLEPSYQTWAERVHPDDLPVANEKMRKGIEEKGEFRYEYRIIWPDGSVRWVEGHGKPVYDEDGQCLKVSGLIVDITETKQAELNTQFINQLDFELSQIADADEIIRLATSRLGEYLGVASCHLIEVNPSADLAVVREGWNGWRLDGKSMVGEYRISDFTTPEFREALEAGQAAVVNDVRTDPRTRDFASEYEAFGVGAFVTIPALNEKHWEASLNINHPHARDWRPDEAQLMRDITARLWPAFKRARAVEALRDSEERFRQLAENIGAAFFITEGFSETPPGQLRYVSPVYEKIWGRSRESLYLDPRSWLEAVHPDDIERVLDALRSAGRAQFDEEFRITRPDGEVRWVHDRVFPIRDEAGEIYRLAGIVEDITGRKIIEEALRESEQRYRSVVESQTELICRYLPDTTLTFVNDAYCRFFARTQDELIGTKFLDLIPESAREVARKHIESLVESPRVEIDEHEVMLPDGGIGWQQWVDHAILDSNVKVVEFQAVGRDITERKRIEEDRRDGEERLRLALEAGRMGAWEWDTRTNDVKWSKEHYTVIGIMPFSVEPDYQTWADRVHPDDLPAATEAMSRAIEEMGEYRCEYRIIWSDGSVRWVEGRGKPVYDECGLCVKVSGLIVDITERKEAEEALRESEEALRKSYARIEDLAGRLIASQEEERRHIARELHDDLNQQVAALAIGISRLKRQFPDAGAAVQEQIVKLRNKTDLLSERIRQVSHELHSSVLQHVGLSAALNSYCAEFSDREGIAVALDIGDGIESVSPEAALCLYRVAQESLRNVAMHSGARRAVVTLARANGAVELRVADQGVGFDPGQARECRGLGLVSMEERVKLLHGSFVLTTRPGAGTELRAQIPLRGENGQTTSIVG